MTVAYKRSGTALVADVGEDIVALNPQKGMTYAFTDTTAAVWKLLSEPRSIAEICEELIDAYEVDRVTCQEEVSGLIEQLLAERLVEPIVRSS